MNAPTLIEQAKKGFENVPVGQHYKDSAILQLTAWLTDEQFSEYQPQIQHLIESESWDYLLDSFYQVIPFGTGGRRGEVGIGPNRINPWTIRSSAQGHSQYLIKKYGESAKNRGVVLTYDVRQFFTNKFFNDQLSNPVRNLTGKELMMAAAQVYTANGIKVFVFDGFRTTPELSFAIRHLQAIAGDMFSASHNPPEHNGKKVYDEFGGQLIPPHDEELVTEVTQQVKHIANMPYQQAVEKQLVVEVGAEVDEAYIQAVADLSLSTARDIKIAYTPLHGCGSTSVSKVLEKVGFVVASDPETSNPSGKFEHVTFNNPNPEVIQSFDTPLRFAKSIDADILLSSDPDADRIGIMIKHAGEWRFINGNEIGGVLTRYVIEKKKSQLKGKGVIIKTDVTSNLITAIAKAHDIEVIGNLLVGFKFIGEEMNKLETEGRMGDFLFGCEESHGYIAGNYVREKDASIAALWLAELAAELKAQDKTIIDYLEATYAEYGYFKNYLTEIRMPGAEGMSQIQQIQQTLKTEQFESIGEFRVNGREDWSDRVPLVSETDRVAKSALVFRFVPVEGTTSIKITVRPSGTEPKIKMYFEIGSQPFNPASFASVQQRMTDVQVSLERAFMKTCYKILGVDFPDRGFLLFWQLPLKDKMHYFEIEDELAAIKDISSLPERQAEFAKLTAFLGSNPHEKIDAAFSERFKAPTAKYLSIE